MAHAGTDSPYAAEVRAYLSRPATGRGWYILPVSLLFALAIFVLLPFAELLTPAPATLLEVRDVDILRRPPAATPPRRPPPSAPRPARPTPPRPRPAATAQPGAARSSTRTTQPGRSLAQATLVLPFSFAPDDSLFRGDYGLAFSLGVPSPTGGLAATPPPPEPAAAEPAAPTAYDTADVDRPPRPTYEPSPVYPYRARARAVEGWAEMHFTVTAAGSTAEIEIVAAEPPGFFEQAARTAVQQWRFEPAVRQGRAVPVRARIRLRFELEP